MKLIYTTFLYCLLSSTLLAQVIPNPYSAPGPDIVYAEYFFDTDPGEGSGTSIPLTAGSDVVVNFDINLSSLSFGAHILHVRAQDADGKWTTMQHWAVFNGSINDIVPLFPTYNTPGMDIVAMEYFFDTDPGEGMGTALSVTAGPDVNFMGMINVNALSFGAHILHVRAQDASGKWTLMQHSVIFNGSINDIVPHFPTYNTPGMDIVAMEYFFDTDPGEGMGTALPVTAGPDVDFMGMINTDALSNGSHFFHVRAQDASGKWTLMQHKIIFKGLADVVAAFPAYDSPGADIVEFEYFFDTDPGFGNGLKLDVPDGQDVTLMDPPPCLDGLAAGDHVLHVRAHDGSGKWSLMQVDTVNIASGCNIYLTEITTTCNDNGTPDIFTDDTFDVGLLVSSTDATSSFNVTGDITGSGGNSCITPAPFNNGGSGYPYSGGDLNFTIEDSADPSCNMASTVEVPVPDPVTCGSTTVQLDAAGNASIQPSDVTTSATCGATSVTLDKSSFTCADVGMNTVLVTQTDVEGTMTTCNASVTVMDMIKPNVITQNITVNLDANAMATITPAQIDNGSSDACGIQSLTLDKTDFNCADLAAPVTVTLTVTDNNGNTETGTATVTVTDTNMACCALLLNIPDNPIADDTYRAEDIISTGFVPVGGNVIFKAGNCVTLDPGFEVELGGVFEVLLEVCPD